MSKKKKNQAKKQSKFEFSSVGVWAKSDVGVWTLQEDRWFSLYEGQSDETKGEWFLIERKRNDRAQFLFFGDPAPVTPHFLGKSASMKGALDLADSEISRRRFERAEQNA